MTETTRRGLLRATGLSALGVLAGCVGTRRGPETQSTAGETADGNSSLTDWERSTQCSEAANGMYDSVISVKAVTDDVGEDVDPIAFAELPSEEREILRTVTEAGGYGTCDTSAAFDRFVDRVHEHGSRSDSTAVYLEREGEYYRLYVEVTDQVYSY